MNRQNYEKLQFVAGQLWALSDEFQSLPHSSPVACGGEARKQNVNLAVANAICGNSTLLSASELVFLCHLAAVKNAEVARYLAVNRSNITLWTRGDRSIPRQESLRLKKWFWLRIFGQVVGSQVGPLPTAIVFDDQLFLQYLMRLAISEGAALSAEAVLTYAPGLLPTGGRARRPGSNFLNR